MSEYYSGGYVLIRADRPDWPQMSTDLLPDKLISLSHCICPSLDVTWGWSPGNEQAALHFGIPPDRLDEFNRWCGHEYQADLELFRIFRSPDAVRRFIRRFSIPTNDLFIIGVGLPCELADRFEQKTDDGDVIGMRKRLAERLPAETGGLALGFEVAGFEHDNFGCSWLCSGLEHEMHQLFGIRPGPFGLLSTDDDARQVYDWIDEDEMQDRRAEPVPYFPWLMVSYPLE